jgi:hypothetical protein
MHYAAPLKANKVPVVKLGEGFMFESVGVRISLTSAVVVLLEA